MTTLTLRRIRRLKEERRRALEKALGSILAQLKKMGALKVVLFGSFARGEVRARSDIDIIAVMPSTCPGRMWMRRIYDEVDREVDCDILAYTDEEIKATMPISRFLRYALKEGRVVYEKGA